MTKLRAVLVRPSQPDGHPSIGECMVYIVDTRGYELVALADLVGALAVLAADEVDVIVAADEHDLAPTIEVVLKRGDRPRLLPRPTDGSPPAPRPRPRPRMLPRPDR